MNAALRQRVIEEAVQWLRTPYHHHACVRGVGADCAMFPLAVYGGLGLVPAVTLPVYSPQWHLHRSEEMYINTILQLKAVEVTEPASGDFAVFKFGRAFSHGAIIIAWPRVIHALFGVGVVYGDASVDVELKGRPVRFFTTGLEP